LTEAGITPFDAPTLAPVAKATRRGSIFLLEVASAELSQAISFSLLLDSWPYRLVKRQGGALSILWFTALSSGCTAAAC